MLKPNRLLTIAGGAAALYALVVRGAVTIDLDIGRRVRPLGPIRLDIAAPPPVVFDVVATPYLEKTPHAMEEKLHVLCRGSDMVLAEHFTDVGRWLRAKTVEVVQFERPHRISFHLVRGPVPYVSETFELEEHEGSTAFSYSGEMGSDLWWLGERWANGVAKRWERVVEESLASVTTEAERRAAGTRAGHQGKGEA